MLILMNISKFFNRQKPLLLIPAFFFLCVSNHAQCATSNAIEPVRYFVNHEAQLKTLDSRLSIYKTSGLLGISGIGKTQLARMYAKRNQDKYDLIWFFDSNLDLNESFIELATAINKDISRWQSPKLPENYKESKSAVLKLLGSKSNWLLVFDNIKINQNNKLEEITNWPHNGHVILCSQDSHNLPHATQLPTLTKEEALSLAESIFQNSNSALAKDLVETFKGYPLLVAQGAIFLNDNHYMKPSEYAALLNKSDNKVNAHVELVLKQLSNSAKSLLYKIAVINNQQFSKAILTNITENKDTISDDIYNLIRFGLITQEQNQTKEILEMHDVIKEAILKISGTPKTRENISIVIDKINESLPRGVSSRYLVIVEDETMISNLEELLQNGELYDVDLYKILELRKNLFGFYLLRLNYHKCQKMIDWLLEHRSSFSSLFMSNKDKAVYSMYLTDIALYEAFSLGNYISSLQFLKEAEEVTRKLEGYPEIKFTLYSQLAQAYAYSGDIDNAAKNMEIVDKIIKNDPNGDFDMGLVWYIKAKLALMHGDYEKGLYAISKNIEAEAHLPQDTFTAPTYILQSEILNYMGRYSQAYEISKRIYKQERESIKEDHEIHGRILLQLSRAELGLNMVQEAMVNIKIAKEIYIKLNPQSLNTSANPELAAVFVAEGDVLAQNGQIEEAANAYATAETIYFNCYRGNMHYLDDISYMYYEAAVATYNLKDKFWYNKFSQSLFEKFGRNHARSAALLKKYPD